MESKLKLVNEQIEILNKTKVAYAEIRIGEYESNSQEITKRLAELYSHFDRLLLGTEDEVIIQEKLT